MGNGELGIGIELKKYPDREEAERLVREAEGIYPGPWGDHSRVVARCAEAIAGACGLDADKAYVLGLLHDIGRRFGHGHMAHVYDGYTYMRELGYEDAARVCLTHSFNDGVFEDYIGNVDIPGEKQAVVREALAACEFDDYDRLIQLCDGIGAAEGPVPLEERMGDVKRRYGRYPRAKWNRNFEIKAYFEEKAGKSLEDMVRGIRIGHDVRRLSLGPYILNADVDQTRAYYQRGGAGEACDCAGCRNYRKAAALLPEPVKALMADMGLSPEKPVEIYVVAPEDEGRAARYGGFYHLCGTIEAGPADGGPYSIGPGCAVWFKKECDLIDEAFPRPAFQMEIDFRVPWALDEDNTY